MQNFSQKFKRRNSRTDLKVDGGIVYEDVQLDPAGIGQGPLSCCEHRTGMRFLVRRKAEKFLTV